jgi:lipopolysaccharide transport protein LptA
MASPNSWMKKTQLQSLLLLALFAFFIAHFVLLSPAGLEEDFNGVRVIHPRDLLNFLKNESEVIARNIPTDVPPSYSIRDMRFFASVENRPNWKMISHKSNLYQAQQLVHSRDAQLELPDGTRLTAKEMVMWQIEDRTELYGDVTVLFPNGLVIRTEYAEVKSRPKLVVSVPMTEKVTGERNDRGTRVNFECYGLTYSEAENGDARMLSRVQVWVHGERQTHVQSDYALYQPKLSLLNFQMFEKQSLERQFVRVEQSDLTIRARSLENQIGGGTGPNRQLEKITALGDVKINDRHDPEHVATGTAGKAIFYQVLNEIHLTDFPQVYQDGDTITGDVIVFNRNRDSIEVQQSNAIYNRQ